MLSEQDKKDMLEDGRSLNRRQAFVFLKKANQSASLTQEEYCDFCEQMAQIYPEHQRKSVIMTGTHFLL